jgi:TRAP-type mannitol/chloroaromatic compound transport system substrate-binding protein
MRRRDILVGAQSLAAGAALSFPAPAIGQGLRQLKMVTDWPAGSPGLQSSAERLGQRISAASGGRISIQVFPAGAFVRPFETFDAVGAGVADIYHSTEYYWESKSPAFNFFAAVPFGFTANELFAWVHNMAVAKSCGMCSAGNSTSSRFFASILVLRWAAGALARSPR